MHYPHFHENVDIKSTNILSNISTLHADLLIYKFWSWSHFTHNHFLFQVC